MTNTKTTQRTTWNETTFDADALHLAMIDEINRLIGVVGARTEALRASEAQVRILRKALAYFDIRHAYTQADALAAADALAGEERARCQ